MKGIPILMYHRLFVEGSELAGWPRTVTRYWVPVVAFERQVRALADRGYDTVPLRALLPGGPVIAASRPVVITFDDGWASDYRLARPILEGVGWRSEHFVTVGWVGRPSFLSWSELSELSRYAGIHSHSVTHRDFDRLRPEALRDEVEGSKRRLEDRLGPPVEFLALPGGHGPGRPVVDLARRSGYRGICTSRVGLNTPGAEPFCLRRIPVTSSTSVSAVERWIDGRGLARLAARRTVFRLARRCLGPRLYGALKERLSP